ncbi:hypothetical protein BcepSauron_308 [Burkholderia phage BcepSauron]|uniref:Uncharacterized protein n=1 Tax=Burkholderia phage BcepSauron TaxID=2530033 RepID=A0A482MM04_9CAUD|nr:hypothetical protein H1O17_gp308 [Burkholderia phage BcepSauron]QBQ74688.1 hypothetical protein BcepSauron_308 [Burkholderia phage BcepSauron]
MNIIILRNNNTNIDACACLDRDTNTILASITADQVMSPIGSVQFTPGVLTNQEQFIRALQFINIECQNSYGGRMRLKLENTQAVAFALAMSALVDSDDATVVSAWTNLSFEITLSSITDTGASQSVRFVGKNLTGLKTIVRAQNVTMFIQSKLGSIQRPAGTSIGG